MKNNAHARINAGLPELEPRARQWSWFEFWPVWFFYIPIVIYWIAKGLYHRNLGLPMLANPNIPLGGMVGESKAQILSQAGPYADKYILPFIYLRRRIEVSIDEDVEHALKEMNAAGLSFPLVAKPDLGCRGLGVRVLRSTQHLRAYLEHFPNQQAYLLQQLAPWQAEAGIFYVRMPGEMSGQIKSITLKYRPVVLGDGQTRLVDLMERDPRARKLKQMYLQKNAAEPERIPEAGEEVALSFSGNHCRGAIFRDGNEFICKEMTAAIDKVMQDFPEFYYGRLDVKFRDMQALQAGEDFCVIEINGASSEATHIWDSRTSFREVFRTLFWQYRTLFAIGLRLRAQGRSAPGAGALIKAWIAYLRTSSTYPPGE